MTASDLVDRLAQHTTVGGAPRDQLAWLASHGSLRRLDAGEQISTKGSPVIGMFVVLSGCLAIFVDRGAGRNKVMDWRAGDVTGVLPFSRLVDAPGDVIAQEATELLVVPRGDIAAMIRDCPEVTAVLVHKMLDRARVFNANDLHNEKMVSLGKLSAGLAHELNNPASAIERSASLLEDRLDDAERATAALGATNLTDAQLAAIDALRKTCLSTNRQGVLSPIQQAEREDAITEWLAGHHVDASVAGPLAETTVTIGALDRIAVAVTESQLDTVVRWAAAICSVRGLSSEIQEAAMRISGLVMAIKGFTHMDQATVAEPLDVAFGLHNTVAVVRSKARAKSIAVAVTVAPDLPRARGFAGELNQIWANLIDNALDAAPESGRVDVSAARELDRIVVRVVDNGPGIPDKVRGNLFEPFVTTKLVGKGTGLGLDIVRKLVNHNDGGIEFDSVPGRTEFRVSLPVAEAEGAGAKS